VNGGPRTEACYALFEATGSRDYLAEAHRLVLRMREGAPEALGESLVANVPLHKEIVAAWDAAS